MNIEKDCIYSVAPLTEREQNEVLLRLRGRFVEPSGIPTVHICREVAMMWPDGENNLCYAGGITTG